MARVLALSFRFPYPLTDGARIRIYNLCKILAQEHTVDLVSLNEGPVPADSLRYVTPMFGEVYSFPFHPIRFKLNTLKGVLSRDSLQTYYHHFGKVQRWVDRNLSRYDLIFCFHIRMSRYLRGVTGVPRAIDFIDATSVNYRETQERARGIWRLVLPIENRRALAYELRMLDTFDKAFITSAHDKAYLERHAGRRLNNLIVIPNGVREDLLLRPPVEDEEDWIVFLGKMNYAPNVDAVMYFAKEVFPHVRARLPEAKFVIVGTSPAKEVLKLARIPGISVTGYVEDPYVYLERATVIVAPLRFAAGIQNKILEAMALRKAVVTTSKGARGITAQDGEHFLVADEPEDIAEKVVQLWRAPELRAELGHNARRLIEQQYRWDVIAQRLLTAIDVLVSGK
ncbi:MAG: glycosyltransferase [Clostridiales bacterium]|nr:glycosyltransferase [Clostridiales bacterium]